MTNLLIGAACGALLAAACAVLWVAWYFSRSGGPLR